METKTKVVTTLAVLSAGFLFAVSESPKTAKAANVDYTYSLGAGEGSSQPTANKTIIAHETGVPNASAQNNAAFEKRTWDSNGAYVAYIVGNANDGTPGHIYQVGQPGYIQWGAGTWANANSPVQIELAETDNYEDFKVNYATYINLIRESANAYGIPLTVDDGNYWGVKSHNWISNNIWGDHTDPYGYLSKMGISPAQFARDVQNGVSANQPTPKPQPSPKPSQPDRQTRGRMTVEDGWFKNGDEQIAVHSNSKVGAPITGYLPAGTSIHYYGYVVDDGYTWIGYTGYNGKRLYCPVRVTGQEAWGTFK
ncbi:N-acetylmuramoyl-L-alanine amidase [Fructilactobacillus cliffordii]|uniref:N-acetylmuramoyl-L-alanine amidase n=1 Tax=Fructilactobacillus cliffordii TaxID=2940299 RepID=UPI002092B620|nr:N-acetylmuramoyl-L-alanine amidase [Fructilactobacillus cliffordii]USS86510.1 N-acetylmuramoyl-L-alanine amidase [Fructilactobacillus cliffordii]